MNDFEEYLRQGEPNKAEKAKVWKTAIGLQQVDGMKPSEYFIEKRNRFECKILIFRNLNMKSFKSVQKFWQEIIFMIPTGISIIVMFVDIYNECPVNSFQKKTGKTL